MKTEYLILGGGIAGLSTAIALKKIGIEALVLESAVEAKPVGAGITLASNALMVYRKLGIYSKVVHAGIELKKATIKESSGRTISEVDLSLLGENYSNLGIHRAALHEVLLSELAPDQVLWNKRAVSFHETGQGITVQLEEGSSIEASYLIVADGIHSAIRKQLLPQSKIRYAGYTCWRGIAENRIISRGLAHEIWGKQGRFGYVPIDDDRIYWFATKRSSEKNQKMKAMKGTELVENFKDYPKEVTSLIAATPDESILWNDIIDLNPIKNYAFNRVVLIGDAAHATTPNMGQGACQAIEDAWFLSQEMAKNSLTEITFKNFETKRVGRSKMIVQRSFTLGKIAEWRNPLSIKLRNSLFRTISTKNALKQMKKILNIEAIA